MSLTGQVAKLVAQALTDGWCIGNLTAAHVRYEARWTTLRPIVNRTGSAAIERLRAVDAAAAPTRSLSAIVGLGAQPLHTDGAHLTEPPDIVVLFSEAPSDVPTLVSRFTWEDSIERVNRDDFVHGLFSVDSGRSQFLAPAWSKSRLRFDPGCMTPADARAGRVVAHFTHALDSAESIHWREPGMVLAIDNRTFLHARGDSTPEPNRTLKRLSFRIAREAQT